MSDVSEAMYKAFFPLILVISVGSAGCKPEAASAVGRQPQAASAGREPEAASAGRENGLERKSPGWEPGWEKPSPERMPPPPITAKGTKSSEKLRVEVEEIAILEKGGVEADQDETGYTREVDEESPAPRTSWLGLRVRVVNDYENLKIQVRLNRFQLETGSGKRIKAHTSAVREPRFPEVYLSGGQSVAGWLVFDVPQGEKRLILTSNLRIPPLRLPVLELGE